MAVYLHRCRNIPRDVHYVHYDHLRPLPHEIPLVRSLEHFVYLSAVMAYPRPWEEVQVPCPNPRHDHCLLRSDMPDERVKLILTEQFVEVLFGVKD